MNIFKIYSFLENLLNNQEKILGTPISQLIEWKINPTVIEQLKSQPIEEEPGFQNLFENFQQTKKVQQIKFKAKTLDDLTEGGIDVGIISEFYGEAGGGKTQICLQLALSCALPVEHGGVDGMTFYISTDKPFPVLRMNMMAEAIKLKYNIDIPFLDKVLVKEIIETPDDLKILTNIWIPLLLEQFPVKLIIIDSIASVFRMNDKDYIKRAQDMREIVNKLNVLADLHNLAIVTTNHLTSVPQVFGDGKEIASLGKAWDCLIVTKFRVKKSLRGSSESGSLRTLTVEYCPRLPKAAACFSITSTGIV